MWTSGFGDGLTLVSGTEEAKPENGMRRNLRKRQASIFFYLAYKGNYAYSSLFKCL